MIAAANDNPLDRFNPLERRLLHPPPHKRHPDYRIELEVLARIPLMPCRVRFSSIAADLDVNPIQVEKVIDRLRVAGYRIIFTNSSDGFHAGMSIVTWDKAQAIAEAYLDTVYASWSCSPVAAERTPADAS